MIGKTPSEEQVRELAGWICEQESLVFSTDRLPLLYEPAKAFAQTGSGVLAVRDGAEAAGNAALVPPRANRGDELGRRSEEARGRQRDGAARCG